jgi:hypothetical protein
VIQPEDLRRDYLVLYRLGRDGKRQGLVTNIAYSGIEAFRMVPKAQPAASTVRTTPILPLG